MRCLLMLVLCLLPGLHAAELAVTTEPAGALVRWTAPDSPVVHQAGPTPRNLQLPPATGRYTVWATLPGYLPSYRDVTDADRALHLPLRRFSLDLLPQIATHTRGNVDGEWLEWAAAADGAGMYFLRERGGEGEEGRRFEVGWQPVNGASQVVAELTGVYAIEPELAPSPDGKWVAWSTCDRDSGRIEARRRDGGPVRVVVKDPDQVLDFPVWSPDGTALLYNRYPGGASDGKTEQLLAPWGGGPPRVLARQSRDQAEATFSPDGQTVFTCGLQGVHVHHLVSGQVELLPGTAGALYAQLSPDGQWLAIARYFDPARRDGLFLKPLLQLRPMAGGPMRDLAGLPRRFAWLPDASGLLVEERGDPWLPARSSLVIELAGQVPRRYGEPEFRVLSAGWTPAGNLSLETVDREGERSTRIVDLAGQPAPPEQIAEVLLELPPGPAPPAHFLYFGNPRGPGDDQPDEDGARAVPARISPDGRTLAGVWRDALWVAPVDRPDQPRRVTPPEPVPVLTPLAPAREVQP